MKKSILMLLFVSLLICGCAKKKSDGEKAQQNYKLALEDSIKSQQRMVDSCNMVIDDLKGVIDSKIGDFAVVENPREVEGYYILKNWIGKYPLKVTGLVARISKSEQLELIAAAKGLTFDQILIESGDQSVESAVVPHDQALNYRLDGLTTVMFSGEKGYEIGEFVANNELNDVKMVFLEGGKVKGNWTLPADTKKMVSLTWLLSNSMKELNRNEMKVRMLHQKIDILRHHIE